MVPARPIDAALRRVDKNFFRESGLANALGDIFFFGERLAGRFVFDELNAEEQTKAANIADIFVRSQRSERDAQSFAGG